MAEAKPTEEVSGTISHIHFSKPTWTAGRLHDAEGKNVSFSLRGFVRAGDCVTLVGEWEDHPEHGRQFKAHDMRVSLPATPAGLVKWLQWNVLNVGPVTAQRLVDEFGAELMDRCCSDAEAVAIAGRLPLEIVEGMAAKWQAEKSRGAAFTFLAGLGLTQKQCEAIVQRLGNSAVAVVKEDPFALIGRVEGFGWKNTDALAKKLNIGGDDPRRLRGALQAVVRDAYDKGSTCLNVGAACRIAAEKLAMRDPQPILEQVDPSVERGDLKRFGGGTEDTDYLATPWAYRCESATWRALMRARERNPFGPGDWETAAKEAESYRRLGGITFDDAQVRAIASAIRFRVSVITGGAGSGKTAVSKAIVKYFADGDVDVFLCAPTGKAARRMSEVIGRPASTVHRLLGYNGSTGAWSFDELNQLDNCVILVDEASMVDVELAYRLFAAAGPRCAIVLVGDPFQLPPVGPGSPLRDMIDHDLAPLTRLEHCHRQAGALKENSVAILSGRVEPTVEDQDGISPWIVNYKINNPVLAAAAVKTLYEKYLPAWGFDPISETQFLSARHDGWFGTKRLNLLLQHLHQRALGNEIEEPHPGQEDEPIRFHVGDKVIQSRNNYNLNVFNGEVGVVRMVAPNRAALRTFLSAGSPIPLSPLGKDDHKRVYGQSAKRTAAEKPVADFVIDFPDRRVVYPVGAGADVQLAYCLSVHKCVHPDTLVETEEGLLPIRKIAGGGWIASPAGPKRYRNKVANATAPALRITTKSGRHITVTPDHGVEVWTGEQYERREASALSVGDWVRTKLGVTVEPAGGYADLPRGAAADVRLPEKVNAAVAEFFGLMVAGGRLDDKGFRLLHRDRDVIERFSAHCRQLFGVAAMPSGNGAATGYEVNSTHLAAWLREVGGMSPSAQAVPECILRSPSAIQAEFLRGLLEGATEFTTTNDGMAQTVQVMLARLGIIAAIKTDPATVAGSGARRYRLSISGSEHDQIHRLPISRDEADALGESAESHARFTRTVSRATAARAGWNNRLAWFDDTIARIEPVECESMCVEVPDGNRFLQNGFPWSNCQGSQVKCAIVLVPKSSAFIQSRSWLYTAVTRAQTTAIIAGDEEGILWAARKVVVDERQTVLRVFGLCEEARP